MRARLYQFRMAEVLQGKSEGFGHHQIQTQAWVKTLNPHLKLKSDLTTITPHLSIINIMNTDRKPFSHTSCPYSSAVTYYCHSSTEKSNRIKVNIIGTEKRSSRTWKCLLSTMTSLFMYFVLLPVATSSEQIPGKVYWHWNKTYRRGVKFLAFCLFLITEKFSCGWIWGTLGREGYSFRVFFSGKKITVEILWSIFIWLLVSGFMQDHLKTSLLAKEWSSMLHKPIFFFLREIGK